MIWENGTETCIILYMKRIASPGSMHDTGCLGLVHWDDPEDGRKVMTKLDSILKSRDITLPTKVRLVKAMVFPVVMYGCESWTVRKLSTEELMLLNCGVEEDSSVSLGQQGDPTSPS